MNIKSILGITYAALSIWKNSSAKKYLKQLKKLEEKRDKETDKNPDALKKKDRPDHNIIDRLDRDIVRISNLVSVEIQRSPFSTMP